MSLSNTQNKILFIDVDGTLVDYNNVLPQSAVLAIRKARTNGHRVYICTGRSEAEIPDYIRDIGLDGIIGGNGCYIKSDDEVIFHQQITQPQAKHIVDWLTEKKLEFYLESNSGLYASMNFEKRAKPTIAEYQKRKAKDTTLGVRDVFPDMVFPSDNPNLVYPDTLYRDDLNKVSFILDSYQNYLDAIIEFPDLKVGTWGGSGETALFGDIGIKNIDKGHSIDVLIKHIGASIENTIAFGDAKVDIPMLEKCNIGVAVASGGPEIKAMADYVTDTVSDDGLYKAFVHLGLITAEL